MSDDEPMAWAFADTARMEGWLLIGKLLEPSDLRHEALRPSWPAKRRRVIALHEAIIACAASQCVRRGRESLRNLRALKTYCEVEFKREKFGGSLKRAMAEIPLARATVLRHRSRVEELYGGGKLNEFDWVTCPRVFGPVDS